MMKGLIHRLGFLFSNNYCSVSLFHKLITATPTSRIIRRGWCSSDEKVAAPIIRRKGKGDSVQPPLWTRGLLGWVRGGNGGDGCIAFTKIFGNEFAGPDGGDGGNGGHVVFEATNASKSLAHLPGIILGNPGGRGKGQNCTGANGALLTIPVPVGTIFKTFSSSSGPESEASPPRTITDLDTASQFFIGAKGGAGGKGNKFFATALNQSPEICEFGAEGEQNTFLLEMSVMADFGLVGFPNAGKSTLLRAISRARPKVASNAFTTLKPHVGVVFFEDMERVTVADIPGLIPDAHRNRGLGIAFLRHIQRCLGLIYVIDFTDPEPLSQFSALHHELSQYDSALVEKHSLILANKLDSEEAKENYSKFKGAFLPEFGQVLPISAKFSMGLKELLERLRRVSDQKKIKRKEPEVYNPVREGEGVGGTDFIKWRWLVSGYSSRKNSIRIKLVN